MMMPMKTRAPRIPPITAPVDGPGVICRFSSLVGDTEKQKEERGKEKRDKFITISFKFHVTASGTLMLLTCSICIFMCFAAEICEKEYSLCGCMSQQYFLIICSGAK